MSDIIATADERVRAVFERVRAADISVADLYNVDATLNLNGAVHRGRDAIRQFYQGTISGVGPQPHVRTTLGEWPLIAALLDVTMADGSQVTVIDLFELDDRGIVSMTVFSPGPPPARP